MPYAFESKGKKIPREPGKDRRVKLSEAQKDEIRELALNMSQRELASRFGVSRRTISFILDPEKRAANYERRKERGGSAQYYDRETHAESMRRHRRHKKALDDKGELE
ncbi:helix-turn-helix DNA binding domain protein [Rhodobacter phage RcCWillis]|nr:helix-turn-helix DNA binding domain protein [Rhodobacter phage RcCWillis]